MAQVKYKIVEKWANWDSEKQRDVQQYFSSKEHAQIVCDELNAKRSVIHFNVFVVELI